MSRVLIEKDLNGFASVGVSVGEGALHAYVKVPVGALLDLAGAKVKAAIPGQVDDVIIDLVIATAKAELLK